MQGGAYGCSLGFSQISGIATYSSYRDPNVASTLAAYDATGDYLREHPLSAADLSKAIIGAVGALDTPQSVNGKGSSSNPSPSPSPNPNQAASVLGDAAIPINTMLLGASLARGRRALTPKPQPQP